VTDRRTRSETIALVATIGLACVGEGRADPTPDAKTQLVHGTQTANAPSGTAHADSTEAADDGVPVNMLSFFVSETCPAGWREVEAARGRALLGTIDPSRVGVVSRETAFAARTVRTHVHLGTVSKTVEPAKSTFLGLDGCTNETPFEVKAHHHRDGTIHAGDAKLPFVHQRLCEKVDPSASDRLPYATYGLFNRASCPTGWQRVDECSTCPNLDGRTIVPLLDGFAIKAFGKPWLDPFDGQHEHSFEGTISPSDEGLAAWGGTNHRAARGKIAFSGNTTSMTEGRMLPTIQFFACVKTTMGEDGGHPPNMTIFHGGLEDCPEGWSTTWGTGGRFIIASPAGDHNRVTFGDPKPLRDGEDRVHYHRMTGNFDLAPHVVCLVGGDGIPIAGSGIYSFDINTHTAAAGVPYVQLRQCTYTGQR
jgi:hypothetical protein